MRHSVIDCMSKPSYFREHIRRIIRWWIDSSIIDPNRHEREEETSDPVSERWIFLVDRCTRDPDHSWSNSQLSSNNCTWATVPSRHQSSSNHPRETAPNTELHSTVGIQLHRNAVFRSECNASDLWIDGYGETHVSASNGAEPLECLADVLEWPNHCPSNVSKPFWLPSIWRRESVVSIDSTSRLKHASIQLSIVTLSSASNTVKSTVH